MVGGRPTGDRQVTARTPSIGRSLPGRRPEKLLRIYQIFREIARGPIGDQQGTAQASVGFNSLLNFSKRSPSVLYVQQRPSVLTERPVAVLKCDLSLIHPGFSRLVYNQSLGGVISATGPWLKANE